MTAELRGAIGSASVQQFYSKCHLIVWAGGRVSLQSLWWGTERSGVTVRNWQDFGGWGGVWSCVQIMSCGHFGQERSCAQF